MRGSMAGGSTCGMGSGRLLISQRAVGMSSNCPPTYTASKPSVHFHSRFPSLRMRKRSARPRQSQSAPFKTIRNKAATSKSGNIPATVITKHQNMGIPARSSDG